MSLKIYFILLSVIACISTKLNANASECRYVHPVIKNLNTPVEYQPYASQQDEAKDVRLIRFFTDKIIFFPKDPHVKLENYEGESIKTSCKMLYPKYDGPKAVCMSMIQCKNQAELQPKVCQPINAMECPLADECLRDQTFKYEVVNPKDPHLKKPSGIAFKISQNNTSTGGSILILGKTNADKTNLANILMELSKGPFIPKFEFRAVLQPYIHFQESTKQTEDITFAEALPPSEKYRCVDIYSPWKLSSSVPPTDSQSHTSSVDITSGAGSAE